MLKIKELSTGYRNKIIIDKISFDVNEGEIVCIIGPNGCGKSTLLKAINHIIDYTGAIMYNEINLGEISNKELGKIMGLLSQNKSNYFSYSIYETVAMGAYSNSNGLFRVDVDEKTIKKSLTLTDLYDIRNQRIDQISGGQYQRAMIARLIVQNPKIIMLDEPTNHLDLKHQFEILSYIKKWVMEDNKIAVVVLHDLNLVQKYADKVILIDSNHEFYIGKPKDILTNERLKAVYDIDVKDWMKNLLKLWE
ncbi:MAG: ABC transporter ATP-binding protein [Bacilli bacterium]